MASRAVALSIFGALGFAIGFLAFLASPAVGSAFATIIPQLVVDQGVVFAMISGIAGAAISTTVVSVWAKRP